MDSLTWRVLEELPEEATEHAIEVAEQKWIDLLKPRYNASQSVNRHCLGRKTGPLSDERKQKIREAVTGFKHTPETKAKLKGRRGPMNLTEAHRETLRANGRRRGAMGQTKETCEKIRRNKTGVVRSEEAKQKCANALKNKPWSEARRKAHATGKKLGAPAGKPWSEARRQAEKAKYPFGRRHRQDT